MTQIEIISTATAQERVRVSQRLTRTWASAARRILPIVLLVSGSVGFGVGIGWVLALPLHAALLVSLYSMIGTCLGFALTQWINGPVQMKELLRSAVLNGPSPMVLDPRGVTLAARSIPWAQVVGVMHSKEGIILMCSKADGILVPERDLPGGLTAEDLMTQITTWKAAE